VPFFKKNKKKNPKRRKNIRSLTPFCVKTTGLRTFVAEQDLHIVAAEQELVDIAAAQDSFAFAVGPASAAVLAACTIGSFEMHRTVANIAESGLVNHTVAGTAFAAQDNFAFAVAPAFAAVLAACMIGSFEMHRTVANTAESEL
jgi:hypothetical protein